METTRSGDAIGGDTSTSTGSRVEIKDTVAEIGRDLRDAAANQGRETLRTAKRGVDEALADAGGKAAARLDGMADTAHEFARSLDEHGQTALGRFAEEAASSIGAISERVRGGNIDALVNDAYRLARSNPGLFVLGSVAIGLGLARFLKAGDDTRAAGSVGSMSGPLSSSHASSRPSQSDGGRHVY